MSERHITMASWVTFFLIANTDVYGRDVLVSGGGHYTLYNMKQYVHKIPPDRRRRYYKKKSKAKLLELNIMRSIL